jgi:hypothetical protein
MTYKAYKKTQLRAFEIKIQACLVDAEIMFPSFFSGRITRRQFGYFFRQVHTVK